MSLSVPSPWAELTQLGQHLVLWDRSPMDPDTPRLRTIWLRDLATISASGWAFFVKTVGAEVWENRSHSLRTVGSAGVVSGSKMVCMATTSSIAVLGAMGGRGWSGVSEGKDLLVPAGLSDGVEGCREVVFGHTTTTASVKSARTV
ncbi:hypothetical protein AYL99_02226 [Fonsecaea erecta]|uniref:Uncharacterized protein n=1 Tax=Fonsecaea erecta TaxID=1367422 RepID=A0A178ZT65_9EURO|nr:hypothetical protein AYL99_02226 [Fonsecaea erecta]OAP62999.1 hypothetical protein AYL99_02226 [Fonsecaea erecta]